MPALKQRAKTLIELASSAAFYVRARPLARDEKAEKLLAGPGRERLARLQAVLEAVPDWSAQALEAAMRSHAEQVGAKIGDLAQPLRAALTGSPNSPSIFEVMQILGRRETIGRIADALRA
jgi:glutamyl-tRNA synthetase